MDLKHFEQALGDPQTLEKFYQQAKREGQTEIFEKEIARRYAATPDNLLVAAWYFRLQNESRAESQGRSMAWRWAVPLGLVLSLIFWLVTPNLNTPVRSIPTLFLLWAPATACMIIVFLFFAGRTAETTKFSLANYRKPLLILLGIVLVTAYAMILGSPANDAYRTLLVFHLPLLATLGVGLYLVSPLDDQNSFAALHKGAEVVLTGGIIVGAAMAFVAITLGLFSAIGIEFIEPVKRYLLLGVPGLVPVLAMAIAYDPKLAPIKQRFDQGFSKLVFTVARLFLPLTILVGIVYIASIPANFLKPFEQRDVLIVYNVMLFAVMALLSFATPLNAQDVSSKWQVYLRWAIIVIALMAVLVSLYALSATVYRTMLGGATANRVTVIGWNALNIGILCLFLFRQFRANQATWIASTQRVFRLGMIGYGVWGLFITLVIPLLFH
jgi:hypothetical protein